MNYIYSVLDSDDIKLSDKERSPLLLSARQSAS